MQYTTEIRIPKKSELTEYLDEYSSFFNSIYRYALRVFLSGKINDYKNISEFVKYLMRKFGILERTANAIAREAYGRRTTAKKMTQFYLSQAQSLRSQIKKEIKTDKERLLTSIKDQRSLKRIKRRLYYKNKRLEELNKKIRKYKYALKNGRFSIVQGGKKLFNARNHLEESGYSSHESWLKDFRDRRDRNIFYLGRNSDRQGNGLCQLFATERENIFRLRVRKEYRYSKTGQKFIEIDGLKLSYLTEEVRKQLQEAEDKTKKTKSIYLRFHKRDRRGWYLQITIKLDENESEVSTQNGAIGIDLNNGFLEVVEIDSNGSFIHKERFNLDEVISAKKSLDSTRKACKQIALQSRLSKRPIVIEDLDFIKKKRKAKKNKTSKKYNRMIHSLNYSQFKESLLRAAGRNRSEVIIIDPAYTSKIGREKYLDHSIFDSVHEAAAFVIARRGLGIKEELYNY